MGEQGEFDAMPARWVPRVIRAEGRTVVYHGPHVLFDVADGDVGMRNFVLVSLTESGVCSVRQAAELFGVRPEHVSRLRAAYAEFRNVFGYHVSNRTRLHPVIIW